MSGGGMESASFVKRAFGRGSAGPYIVAEIGSSHGADLGRARELIAAAKESGAHCAKFQYVIADEIIHPKTGLVPLPGGDIALFDAFRRLERPPSFYEKLIEACQEAGIDFLCSPFGLESASRLMGMGVKALKIASPELNHYPLLSFAAECGLPVVLSTGVSLLSDIEEALSYFPQGRAMLLHCVTSYPAPPEHYNLRLLPALSCLFGVEMGISDHSLDPVLLPLLAYSMGAVIIEKHFCLSRDGGGLDDPIALDPARFSRMSRALKDSASKEGSKIIEELSLEYGAYVVEACLGSGRKALAPSERDNYGRTNRSLHAKRRIEAGETLDWGNIALLRTEKRLRPGLHPRYIPLVIGRKAARTVDDGEGILAEDIA